MNPAAWLIAAFGLGFVTCDVTRGLDRLGAWWLERRRDRRSVKAFLERYAADDHLS